MTERLAYTAVVPTKDRPERAREAVVGLLAQTRPPQRIVVVDASDPPLQLPRAIRATAEAAGSAVEVVHTEPSTAGQRNRGIERAETPLVLLLDDDVSLEHEYAQRLLERWERDGLEAFSGMVGVPEYFPPQSANAARLRRALMLHYQDPGAEATDFRPSRKLRIVPRPRHEVVVPACGAGFGLFRTDLLRKHPFDERFPGYAPGEDLDATARLAREAPLLQTPAVRYLHEWDPRERTSPDRWYQRGRSETYFRLKHLGASARDRAAFGVSLAAEAGVAAAESVRERDSRHVRGFLRGVRESLREHRYRE